MLCKYSSFIRPGRQVTWRPWSSTRCVAWCRRLCTRWRCGPSPGRGQDRSPPRGLSTPPPMTVGSGGAAERHMAREIKHRKYDVQPLFQLPWILNYILSFRSPVVSSRRSVVPRVRTRRSEGVVVATAHALRPRSRQWLHRHRHAHTARPPLLRQ